MAGQDGNLQQDDLYATRELVKSAFGLARALGIGSVLVQADEISPIYVLEFKLTHHLR